jgi:uncharacterized protein (TIGR02271 family)
VILTDARKKLSRDDMSQKPEFNKQSEVATSVTDNQLTGESVVIPVIEEQVQIEKHIIETGKVVVEKKVFEEAKTVDISLIHEEHDVERITVNQYVDTAPGVRYEGDTMIIPVMREEVVIQKRLMLIEELRITKRQVETSAPQQVTLRREEVTVERVSNTISNQESEIAIRPIENTK